VHSLEASLHHAFYPQTGQVLNLFLWGILKELLLENCLSPWAHYNRHVIVHKDNAIFEIIFILTKAFYNIM
jgi:hypothetical protein